ncbi:MAG: FeoA family protein [Thermodesulfobacteriota bacterium]
MPLGILGPGERAEITEIRGVQPANPCNSDGGHCGPRTCARTCRIEEIGLRAGKLVEMLNNDGRGALLVKIDETRIAIGRGMAMKVMVRRMD